mgnify:CR=1 FL=1
MGVIQYLESKVVQVCDSVDTHDKTMMKIMMKISENSFKTWQEVGRVENQPFTWAATVFRISK